MTEPNTPNTSSDTPPQPIPADTEQRRFTRVPFVSHISLQHGDQQWQGHVVDISFNGALVEIEGSPDLEQGQASLSGVLAFENDTSITVDLKLAHHHQSFYGFCFSEIDSDSLSYLHNIIRFNLGDAKTCERELMSLFSYHQ